MLVSCLVAFLCFYTVHMIGITVGYHRLLAHRSYTCPKFVEYILVMAGYLGFESSPMWWATLHRAHHRYTDTELDPHAPKYGMYEAYIGWFLHKEYADYLKPEKLSRDMVNDPLYKFLDAGGDWHRAHLLNSFINFSLRGIMALIWGWEIAAASLAAALVVQQMPLLLNVVCHIPKAGYKNFNTADTSVNVGWVAFLTLGEGWHNNHHAFPGSARHGLTAAEIDPSWLIIRAMKALGLVGWMNEVTINTQYKGKQDQAVEVKKPVELEIVSDLHAVETKDAVGADRLNQPLSVTVLADHTSTRTRAEGHRRARQKVKR